jgi:hypothetical protein
MTRTFKVINRSMLLVVLVLLVQIAPAFAQGTSNPGVLSPDSHPFGKTYQEWSNVWYQWALSIPVPAANPQSHPLFDETGANCASGQTGHVWFLGGVFNASGTVVRNCKVPTGTALFFPIVNFEVDRITPPVLDLPGMRSLLDEALSQVSALNAEVDGVSIDNLSHYNTGSNGPTFSVTLPDNNIYQFFGFDVPAGTYQPLISGGYYLMLAPLPPGEHTIHFTGINGGFLLDITYHLIVGR